MADDIPLQLGSTKGIAGILCHPLVDSADEWLVSKLIVPTGELVIAYGIVNGILNLLSEGDRTQHSNAQLSRTQETSAPDVVAEARHDDCCVRPVILDDV